MRKGVKLTITGQIDSNRLNHFLLKFTEENQIQGTMQSINDSELTISALGDKDRIESLIDELYNDNNGIKIDDLDIKPLDEPKDFRGIFRIVQ